MLYTAEQTAQLPAEGFRYLLAHQSDHVLTITLNRPEKKNALNPPLLAELAFALAYAHFLARCVVSGHSRSRAMCSAPEWT